MPGPISSRRTVLVIGIELVLLLGAAQSLTPFPLPASLTVGNSSVAVSGSLAIKCSSEPSCSAKACTSDVMTEAFKRYTDLLAPKDTSQTTTGPELTEIDVCVRTADLSLGPKTKEDYSVSLPAIGGAAQLGASSVYGALHALESMLQLVDVAAGHIISNAPVMIKDQPRFGYRGLMIDTSRHFLPIDFLMRVVDGLHANRLNLLHWHIVDSNSFPCGSDKFPQLAQKGAYDPRAIYSTADMRALVAYARLRGVRVMPEWDIPGHGAWGAGMPSLMGCSIVLDPTNNATYDFLNEFFTEMMTIFTDEYVHLGGDEVDFTCWDANPEISAWLKAHRMNSSQLQQYFWHRMSQEVLPKALAGRTVSIWENDQLQIDPDSLPNGTVANVYQSKTTADETIGKYNMPSVLSIASNNWYLDSQCSGYNWNSWVCRYGVEPTSNLTSQPALLPLLLGGEGAMWGEGINKHNFDSYVWHGAAAIAERLWSPADQTQDAKLATPRMAEQMCRMAIRGFGPGPVFPGFCPGDL